MTDSTKMKVYRLDTKEGILEYLNALITKRERYVKDDKEAAEFLGWRVDPFQRTELVIYRKLARQIRKGQAIIR